MPQVHFESALTHDQSFARGRGEAAKGQELEFAAWSTVRVILLHAREVGLHDELGAVHELFIQAVKIRFVGDFEAQGLQTMCRSKFFRDFCL